MATSGASKPKPKSKDILQNQRYFPAFQDLGVDTSADFSYWRETASGVLVQSHTWCFLGEITNDELAHSTFLRNRVFVADRKGQENIPISFYPESGVFNFATLKTGSTICVMFAEQHYFLDMTIGLRIERLDTVKCIPCSLSDLFAISDSYFKKSELECWAVGCERKEGDAMEESAVSLQLKKCGSCKVTRYCSKECQVKDWKERHRRWCKAIPEFVKMAKINYRKCKEEALFGPLGRTW